MESEFAIRSLSWGVARKQLRFFDLPDHLKLLSEAGEPLEEMARVIDFEAFRPLLETTLAYSDGANTGHPPYHPITIFKVLILAAQNDVSDARMEFLIRDRLSWLRLFGFDLGEPTPDDHTMRQFRERLTAAPVRSSHCSRTSIAKPGAATRFRVAPSMAIRWGSHSSAPSPTPTYPLRCLKTASAPAIRAVR